MSRPFRVVLIDDHPMLREGLAMFLQHQDDADCVGQATDQAAATELLIREQPDVAVVDLALGAEDGLEIVRSIRTLSPHTKTLVLTMHEEHDYVRAALLAGANGYALKRGSARDVIIALRRVMAGENYLDPALGELHWEDYLAPVSSDQRLTVLTPRERQVFELVARGVTHREIAEQLGIGKKSVDTYRARLYQKLGINSRAELVSIALEFGVLQKR
ncbi:MAG: two component transcriptional regulator, LuxR family [Myxococcaceae bacterium]|nr:two component transcriptional regulator, LuxR family [Myxococcaceae bacterium]